MCDISLMERKIETKLYEAGELEEESGWTSYLETDYSNVSLFSESSTYSNGSTKILNGVQKDNIGEDNENRLAAITTCNSTTNSDDDDEHKIVGRDGNIIIEEGANYIKGFPDAELESCNYNYNCVRGSSSTLSADIASSFSSSSPIHVISKKSLKRLYPKVHHPKRLLKKSNPRPHINQIYKRISHIAATNHYLEDTATSSPSSALALLHGPTDEDSASSSSTSTFKVNDNETQEIFYEEGTDIAVSTRFKALEALIPRLKEVAGKGKGKEEEMVKVIERHVRHLELQVELLSSAWQLSQLKHQ